MDERLRTSLVDSSVLLGIRWEGAFCCSWSLTISLRFVVDADGEGARERDLLGDLGDSGGRVTVGVGRVSSFKEILDLEADFDIVRPRRFLLLSVVCCVWLELDSSLSGEGGTTVTLGDILLVSEITPSAGVVIKIGIWLSSGFDSDEVVLMVGGGGRVLTDAEGVAAVD